MRPMGKRQQQFARMLASPLLCALLLAGMVAEARTRVKAGDAEPFHRRAAAAIAAIEPRLLASRWQIEEIPVPKAATDLLHPNALLSLTLHERLANGRDVVGNLLIVQCKDAGDMQGHYPKNCYPANGEQLTGEWARTWNIGGMAIPGTEYRFVEPQQGMDVTTRVYNFFVIPEIPEIGRHSMQGIYPDINAIYKSGEDYQRRYYGAAQFQFIFPDEMTEAERDQFMSDVLAPNLSVIEVLLNDGSDRASGGGATPARAPGAPAGDDLMDVGGTRP
jgi:hypothetical protein